MHEIAGSIAVSNVLFLINRSCTCNPHGDDDDYDEDYDYDDNDDDYDDAEDDSR